MPSLCRVVDEKTEVPLVNSVCERFTIKKGQNIGQAFEPIICESSVRAVEKQESNKLKKVSDLEWGSLPYDKETKEKVFQIFDEFKNAVSFSEWNIGRSSTGSHHIELEIKTPVKQCLRPLNRSQLEIVRENVKELEKQELVRKSYSPWASPLVLVKKKDGTERMCIDFRKVNNRTRKDAHPLPRISDIIDFLGGAKYFSTMDLKSGYWQIPLSDDSCEVVHLFAS